MMSRADLRAAGLAPNSARDRAPGAAGISWRDRRSVACGVASGRGHAIGARSGRRHQTLGDADALRTCLSACGRSDQGRRPLPGVLRSRAPGGRVPAREALRGCRRRAASDHRVVLQRLPRHGPASGGPGRRRRGGAHDGRGCRRHAQHLRHDAPARAPGARAGGAARQASGAAVHLGLRRQRGDAVHRLPPAARLRDLFGREEPRVDDRRHSPLGLRQADLPAQRRGASRGAARGQRPRGAQADRVRVGLFDGRRLRRRSPRSATSRSATTR